MAKKKKKCQPIKRKKSGGHKKLWRLFLSLLFIGGIYITPYLCSDEDYYQNAEGAAGAELKTKLHKTIREHVNLNFDQNTTARYWWNNYFTKTDKDENGYFIDMYSAEKRKEYQGGSVQAREHCMPRSWWATKDEYAKCDANGDLHNLFPSDYAANSAKSNLPLGEVGIAKFNNKVSKVGQNTYPLGYQGHVFEPADEYKGDFARVYFYMVTCYEDYADSWRPFALQTMLRKEAYPAFQPWALAMLMKWHENDPVSDKERKRNEAVYKIQKNRNPFVDHPELIEVIWGAENKRPFKTAHVVAKQIEGLPDVIDFYDKRLGRVLKDIVPLLTD